MENVKTEVSILGPKLFHHDTWRVRINGEKWDYDHDLDCFINRHHYVVDRVDMPLLVVVAFHQAWNLCDWIKPFSSIASVPLPAEGLPKPWRYPNIMYGRSRYQGVILLPAYKGGPSFEVSACRGWRKRKL